MITTKIDNCNFPTNYLYDIHNFVWADFNTTTTTTTTDAEDYNKNSKSDESLMFVKVGIMPILSYISGNVKKIKLKPEGDNIIKGKSIGTIESLSYFGVIRSPISGTIIEINKELLSYPKKINDSPFESGWIAKIKPINYKDMESLQTLDQCKLEISQLLKKYNVKCFKNFPDFEMYELGTECSATLAKLDDFMEKKMEIGQIIHLVSDDPTADLEVTRWTDEHNQELLEIMMEKNQIKVSNAPNYLFHILIKKQQN